MIDVGINRTDDGLVGDVEFDGRAPSAPRLITPVPGGVGPMTIAMLLRNTLEAPRRPQARRELSRLRPGELVAAAGGVALLVSLFLDWYARRPVARSTALTAWEAFAVIDVLLALAGAARRSRSPSLRRRAASPALPVALGVITATLGLARDAARRSPAPRPARAERRASGVGRSARGSALAAGGWRSMRVGALACRCSDERPRRPTRVPPEPERRRRRPRRAPRLTAAMLSRDQVLHVARLARLELTEEEVERFGERALQGARPHRDDRRARRPRRRRRRPRTSSTVENALRADEPRPSLPREVALASAPDAAARRLPRPEPGRRRRHERRRSS